MAVGEGFEPSCPMKGAWFSRPASLAAPAPHLILADHSLDKRGWLPNLGDIININSILSVLEDFNYMGMMKERWEDIKRLQSPNLATAQLHGKQVSIKSAKQ